MPLPDEAYARLLRLRTGLRRFLAWSAAQARAAGLSPAHHQLLLAIRGHPGEEGPTIGDVADYLLLRHHSAVGLVDRAEAAGLVRRVRSDEDNRVVRLQLTKEGASRLETLSTLTLEELERLSLDLPAAWAGLDSQSSHRSTRVSRPEADGTIAVDIARVYDDLPSGRHRVLVDRLWPRGVSKAESPFDEWLKAVAPSSELRKWYGHEPERFSEFTRRYEEELERMPAKDAFARLRQVARERRTVLVTATKDLDHSGAVVLRDLLARR